MPSGTDLPSSATPFIGRRRALRTLASVFDRGERLVTIVGAGGIGKTRVALEHARRRAERDTVRFADLSEQEDLEGMRTTVARALRARDATDEEVVATLRRLRRGLLVLDNFEQLVAHARVVREWLDACSDLRVLVTSRELLRLEGEVVVELGPLELDPPEDEDRPSEAALLWSSARQRIDPSYTIASDDHEALEEILSRLDGIPLAIELAAARANLMSTAQLRDRLGRRFDVLRQRSRDRSERHATMEGALDWSWELLEPYERAAIAQCSVFRGSFSLDAAEAVVERADDGGPRVLDTLQALRDKSLLLRVEDDPGRLTTYATIRDYGARRLADDPEAERAAQRRHHAFFARLGRERVRESLGTRGPDALNDLAADLDNFLAVAERALAREEPDVDELNAALEVVVAANVVFSTRGPAGGHRELLDALLARVKDLDVDPVAHAAALRARGLLKAARGAVGAGRADVERAVALVADQPVEKGRALIDLSWTYLRERDLDTVERLCEEAVALAREAGDRQLEGIAFGALGAVPKERGDDAQAAAKYREALQIHREVGNRWFEGQAHTRLGILHLEHGQVGEAREHAESALTTSREFAMRIGEALMLQLLGATAQLEGELEEARDCYAESATMCAEAGDDRLLSTALGYRAISELELGDLEASREHFEEACRAAERVGEHWHGALFRAYIGALEALEGRPDDAAPHFERARKSLKAHPHARMEAGVEVLAALPHVTRAARGEDGARDAANAQLEAALSERDQLTDPQNASADVRIALRIVRHATHALDEADDAENALRVGPSGAWFEAPGEERVDCRRRQALRRILVRLARQRVQQPGSPIPADGLIAAGWPDERMSAASAQNRLYVTINRLRQLGLAEHLQLVEGGYRLDPDLAIALVPE